MIHPKYAANPWQLPVLPGRISRHGEQRWPRKPWMGSPLTMPSTPIGGTTSDDRRALHGGQQRRSKVNGPGVGVSITGKGRRQSIPSTRTEPEPLQTAGIESDIHPQTSSRFSPGSRGTGNWRENGPLRGDRFPANLLSIVPDLSSRPTRRVSAQKDGDRPFHRQWTSRIRIGGNLITPERSVFPPIGSPCESAS